MRIVVQFIVIVQERLPDTDNKWDMLCTKSAIKDTYVRGDDFDVECVTHIDMETQTYICIYIYIYVLKMHNMT